MPRIVLHMRDRYQAKEDEIPKEVNLGRVPCVGEFIGLAEAGPFYLIQAVQHLAFNAGGYVAHIYGLKVDRETALENYSHYKDWLNMGFKGTSSIQVRKAVALCPVF